MLPLIYKPESTTGTGKSTVSYYIFTSNQTNRHLSPSKFLPWLVKEYLIFHVIKRVLIKLPLTTIMHLKNSNFNKNIKPTPGPPKRRKCSRNILWFNPLFSSNEKSNIGKIFLWLLDKHFPKHHKYYKLFNRNNVKISYSCMQNMANIIQKHNTNLLKDPVASTAKECSCWKKSNCPLAEKCLSECLVYHEQVDRSDINQTKNYYGTCKKKFKGRYNNHATSFRNKTKEKSTELSEYIWEFKNSSINYDLKWSIAYKTHPYTGGTRKCDLCLTEKLAIMKAHPESLLNTVTSLFLNAGTWINSHSSLKRNKLIKYIISSLFLRAFGKLFILLHLMNN